MQVLSAALAAGINFHAEQQQFGRRMITADMLVAFAGFAFVTSVTPGPNNTMLLASGVNYGFVRTIPHILGISLGCSAMLLLVGLGLGQLFAAVPALYAILRYVGAAYLLWLAWKIARAGPIQLGDRQARPLRFWQAALFQWVNPKAWVMVVGAVTTYAPRDGFLLGVASIAALLILVNAPSVCLWAGCGAALRQWLSHPGRIRAFNVTMALLLVLSLYPMLQH